LTRDRRTRKPRARAAAAACSSSSGSSSSIAAAQRPTRHASCSPRHSTARAVSRGAGTRHRGEEPARTAECSRTSLPSLRRLCPRGNVAGVGRMLCAHIRLSGACRLVASESVEASRGDVEDDETAARERASRTRFSMARWLATHMAALSVEADAEFIQGRAISRLRSRCISSSQARPGVVRLC
jgi:hypothetical protein